jgi:hypothetical protein
MKNSYAYFLDSGSSISITLPLRRTLILSYRLSSLRATIKRFVRKQCGVAILLLMNITYRFQQMAARQLTCKTIAPAMTNAVIQYKCATQQYITGATQPGSYKYIKPASLQVKFTKDPSGALISCAAV